MSVRFGMAGPRNVQIFVGYRHGAGRRKREFAFVREMMPSTAQKAHLICVNKI
jgi:hypothetical protein